MDLNTSGEPQVQTNKVELMKVGGGVGGYMLHTSVKDERWEGKTLHFLSGPGRMAREIGKSLEMITALRG